MKNIDDLYYKLVKAKHKEIERSYVRLLSGIQLCSWEGCVVYEYIYFCFLDSPSSLFAHVILLLLFISTF